MLNVLETLRLIDNSKCIELDINMQLVILIKKKKDFYCVNVIGDKLILNFGAKFVPHDNLYFGIICTSRMKLQNCHGNLPYV